MDAISPGRYIVIKGLVAHSHLNGEFAKVMSFDPYAERYIVELKRDGETKAVRPECCLVPAAAVALVAALAELKSIIDGEMHFLRKLDALNIQVVLPEDLTSLECHILESSRGRPANLILGMNPSVTSAIPFNQATFSGQRVHRFAMEQWGEGWQNHAVLMNFCPLAFLHQREQVSIQRLEEVLRDSSATADCPDILQVQDSLEHVKGHCGRVLADLVDILEIKMIIAFGTWAAFQARRALSNGHRVLMISHPSSRVHAVESDWLDQALAAMRCAGVQQLGGSRQRAEFRTPPRRKNARQRSRSRSPTSPPCAVLVSVRDLNQGHGPSSLRHILCVEGRIVRLHPFHAKLGGSIRLMNNGAFIDCKFVGDGHVHWGKLRYDMQVRINNFKVLRIVGEEFLRYAAPGARYELAVTESNSEVAIMS
jgi:hypothetical protein